MTSRDTPAPPCAMPDRREFVKRLGAGTSLLLGACAAAPQLDPTPTRALELTPGAQTALLQRINRPGPKKILALDGGGILGLLSVEVLASIEATLRTQSGNPNLVLADYFDLIAGTSTGAIIATCLSLGKSVDEVRRFYLDSGKEMFDKAALVQRLHYAYEAGKLEAKLKEVIGADTSLGTDRLRTLLLVVMRNASTDSAWPVSNNPRAKYNEVAREDCNLRLPLWQLVRASTAAPTFFAPEEVQIGKYRFVFVDGGVTPYNNPAFLAFSSATLPEYAVGWKAAESELLVVSVGTGNAPTVDPNLSVRQMNLLYNATRIPGALMYGAQKQQDLLCRMFGHCRFGSRLDQELGDLQHSAPPGGKYLFTYLRYDADVSAAGLAALGLTDVKPEQVQVMDSVDAIPQIQEVGRAVGRQVAPEHFAGFV